MHSNSHTKRARVKSETHLRARALNRCRQRTRERTHIQAREAERENKVALPIFIDGGKPPSLLPPTPTAISRVFDMIGPSISENGAVSVLRPSSSRYCEQEGCERERATRLQTRDLRRMRRFLEDALAFRFYRS